MIDDNKIKKDKAMLQVEKGIRNVELLNIELHRAKLQYENSLKKYKSNPFLE